MTDAVDALPDLSPSALFSCAGQVAIVTGAGTGIGRVCAAALGAAGARVVLAGLAESQPQRAADELVAQGVDAFGVDCDVTDAAQLAGLVQATLARWGRIDTVLANAGAALDRPDADDALERMDRMYALHVRAVAGLAELTLPEIADGGGGAFIVMSSLSGLRGNRVLVGLRRDEGRECAVRSQYRRAVGTEGHPGERDLTRRDRDRVRAPDHGGCRGRGGAPGEDAARPVRHPGRGRRSGRVARLAGGRVRQRSEHRDRRRHAHLRLMRCPPESDRRVHTTRTMNDRPPTTSPFSSRCTTSNA